MVRKMSPEEFDEYVNGQQIKEDFRQFGANIEYFEKNLKRITREYPDQWVCIYGQRVVDHDKDFMKLADRLSKMNYTTDYIQRTYYKEKPPHFILATMTA
jgi:hypothetical protein